MNRWQKITIVLGAIGVIDLAIAGGGLLALYWTGFPTEGKMVPQPITAAIMHGAIMITACFISCAFHPPRKPSR